MTRLYLAGPMTGIADLNFSLFHAEAARLRALGYEVINPAEINCGTPPGPDAAYAERRAWWIKCMKVDITQLMTCDGVALLPNWKASKGAVIEVQLADDLEMFVIDSRLCEPAARATDWAAA